MDFLNARQILPIELHPQHPGDAVSSSLETQRHCLSPIGSMVFLHACSFTMQIRCLVSAFICYGWLSPYKELHIAAILVLSTLTDNRPQDRDAE